MPRTHIETATKNRWGKNLDQFSEGGAAGTIFFVGSTVSGATDATTAGRTPEDPFATLTYAISQCTANNGDRIYLVDGHSETITGAAGINVNVAGISIIGMGVGRLRATINYSTDVAASFDVNSANILLKNIVFVGTGIDALTAMVNVKAADCKIIDCEFETAGASAQATLGLLTTTAANRMLIQGCHFHGTSDAGTTTAISIVGGTDIRILDNVIQGAFTTTVGCIQQVTTTSVNLIIGRNILQNLTAASTKCIVCTASSTGQIFDNRMQILSGTAPITGAAMSWVGGNAYAATIATAGTAI